MPRDPDSDPGRDANPAPNPGSQCHHGVCGQVPAGDPRGRHSSSPVALSRNSCQWLYALSSRSALGGLAPSVVRRRQPRTTGKPSAMALLLQATAHAVRYRRKFPAFQKSIVRTRRQHGARVFHAFSAVGWRAKSAMGSQHREPTRDGTSRTPFASPLFTKARCGHIDMSHVHHGLWDGRSWDKGRRGWLERTLTPSTSYEDQRASPF